VNRKRQIVSHVPQVAESKMMASGRIVGYDLARGIAFLGMIFVNFKFQMRADENGAFWLLRVSEFLDGRPAVTFMILAGAGLSLLTQRGLKTASFYPLQKPYSTALKRGAFLFFIGLMFTLIWDADILHFYGFYFTVAVFLVNLSSRMLFTLSVAILAASIHLSLPLNYQWLPTVNVAGIALFWMKDPLLKDLFFTGVYPVFPWMIYFLAGMWLGRQDLSDIKLQKLILKIGCLSFLSAEALAVLVRHVIISERSLEVLPSLTHFMDTNPFSPSSSLAILSAGGSALLVIVLSVIIAEKAYGSRWIFPVIATGRMTLTLYIVQITVCELLLIRFDCSEVEFPLLFAWFCAAVCYVMVLFLAKQWISRYERGPFEKLMRFMSS
jgi:uncharacterized membrane protein YeiB